MVRNRRWTTALLGLLLALSLAIPVTAAVAGGYHPAALTVMVTNPPRDLRVSVSMVKEGERFLVPTDVERRGWETYYRVYRDAVIRIRSWYGNQYDFQDARLVVETGGETTELPIPQELLTPGGKFDLLVLDLSTGTLHKNISPLRAPLLLLMRVGAALLLEGLIFHIYGYRERKSWLAFLLVNLVTELGHNIFLSGQFLLPVNFMGLITIYVLMIPAVFLAEVAGMVILIDEKSRDRVVGYVMTANVVSQLLELLSVFHLPV